MKQVEPAATSNSRLKRAELASSFGAGLLGFGLGAMAASYIADLALYVVITGALMHGWGMYDKHATERDLGRPEAVWMKALYWSCWLILAGLAVVLGLRLLS
ncbi:hypothetical protein IMF23_16230 [Chelatococcus daeguensis]|uniref:hypothetical protein n=1 Tax=Chelatococcus daeguensis TaxID=444444 RepID=UPI000A6CBE0B|nr:hypothetical protein [Chelatococcus daeguensis]MBM3084990.1 hypothetical protein [Chelatococcus daeguensis]